MSFINKYKFLVLKSFIEAQEDEPLGEWITKDGRHIFIVSNSDHIEKIQQIRNEQKPITRALSNYLRKNIKQEGEKVMARTKRFESIVSKMRRKGVFTESEIRQRFHDISGSRIIVGSLSRQQEVVEKLKNDFTVSKIDNFTLEPRPDGYRGIHLDILMNNKPPEIQVLTENEYKFARWCRINNLYKTKRTQDPEVRSFVMELSNYYRMKDLGKDVKPPKQPEKIKKPYVAQTQRSYTLVYVLDTNRNTVVWYQVINDDVQNPDDILDEQAQVFKSKPIFESVNDLYDYLWIEDDVYDYVSIPLDDEETPEQVFKELEVKVKRNVHS